MVIAGTKIILKSGFDNISLGYGILLNNYSNTLLYPQVRKVGVDLKYNILELIYMDSQMTLKKTRAGLRFSAPVPMDLM